MKSIVVTEVMSSGVLYIDEIVARGYHPIAVYPPMENAEILEEDRKNVISQFEDTAEFLFPENYEALLEDLRKREVVCVVAGSDFGVSWADMLTRDLGLVGNDPETTYLRTTKWGMYEALKKAGLRTIETAVIKSEKDIDEFWDSHCSSGAVVKYTQSAGTYGLKICSTKEEAIGHYKECRSKPDLFGRSDSDILIQEFVGGTEYIVNSVSRDGKHMITDIWVYTKVRTSEGAIVYDSGRLIVRLNPGHIRLIEYAYKVLDAVGIRNGVCHSEIKIDEKGPILIETNPRPMGTNMNTEYLDELFGHHYADVILDAYLEPERFFRRRMEFYRPRNMGIIKLMIVPKDMVADIGPLLAIAQHLPTFRKLVFGGNVGLTKYEKTKDMETSPAMIKLCGKEEDVIRDYEFIRYVEENFFQMIFSVRNVIDAVPLRTDIDLILSQMGNDKKILIVKDGGTETFEDGEKKVPDLWSIYDACIYAKCGRSDIYDRIVSFLKAMTVMRKGGVVIIVPEAYRSMRYGSASMEIIMRLAQVTIEIPPSESDGLLVGTKE